ncbi:MAG: choice-of-anchor J domain-containing protein [Marinilabiliaceae bacterium]|nr:choice-of-anchor J domain-containing protein [Marinilabiliaceae bacterium]
MRKYLFFLVLALVGYTLTAQNKVSTVSKKEAVRVASATINAGSTNEQSSVLSATRTDGLRAERIPSVDLLKQSEISVHNVPDRGGNRNITTFPWTENFNATTFPPTDWNRIHTGPAGGNWQRSTATPTYDGGFAFRADVSGANQLSLLVTPALTFPANAIIDLEFMSYMGWPEWYDHSSVRVSTTSNSDANDFSIIYTMPDPGATSGWQKFTVNLDQFAGQTIYLAFTYAGDDAHTWRIDNVTVDVTLLLNNDLQILGSLYPFTQVPVSQTIPTTLLVDVNNNGTDPQTNVIVTVTNNGIVIGTSATIPSIAAGITETIPVPVTNPTILLGNNELIYIVTQDQTDENPDDNTATTTFLGTESTFAVDDGSTYWSVGNNSPISIGNIFTITNETVVSAVEAHFSAVALKRFSISLYAMNGNVPETTPIFTKGGIKPTTPGWSYTAVPTTTLIPGDYFLCINQLDDISVALTADNSLIRFGYVLTETDFMTTNDAFSQNVGAPLVRLLVDLPQNDISINAINPILPYTKIPVLQAPEVIAEYMPFPEIITAQAKNVGTLLQTDIEFAATLNGTAIGTSSPLIPSLNPGQTSPLLEITTPTEIVYPNTIGNHNLVYTVTQSEQDDNIDNNSVTFTLEIGDKYALDNQIDCDNGFGTSGGTMAMGNIFPIYKPTKLTEVEVGFQWRGGGDAYSISLYPMASATATGAILWTTTVQTRPDGGFVTITVPETVLMPGSYFLCVNQTTTVNLGVSFDNRVNSERARTRSVGSGGVTLTIQNNFGAAAVRMIVNNDPIADGEIVNITAPVAGKNYSLTTTEDVSVIIKNNGNAPLSGFDLELDLDGTVIATETYTGTIAVGEQAEYTFAAKLDLSAFVSYDIKVTIDVTDDIVSANDSKTINVTNFNCPVINTFPWNYGFEDGLTLDPCWTAEVLGTQNTNWAIVDATTGTPATTPDGSLFKARFARSSTATTHIARLISPMLDLTAVSYPVLKFGHVQQNNMTLIVQYKTSLDGEWNTIETFTGTQGTWTYRTVLLPEVSDTYFIAFQVTAGANNVELQIDDITIATAPATPTFDANMTFALGTVYNNMPFEYINEYNFYNKGSVPMAVSLISADTEITVTGLPMSADPASISSFDVEFDASLLPVGSYTGQFVIGTDDPAIPTFTVIVTANVVAETVSDFIFEEFTATATPAGWNYNRFARVGDGGVNNTSCLRVNNYGSTTAYQADITTSYVNMGTNPKFSFYYKSTEYNVSNPSATPSSGDAISGAAYISNDLGVTWTEIWTLNQGDHVPTTDFTLATADVSAYANQLCQVRIMLRSGYSDGLFYHDVYHWLDDVLVGTPEVDELIAVSISGPVTPTADSKYFYTVSVKNAGWATQSSADYSVILMQDDVTPIPIATLPGVDIDFNEIKEFVFEWIPTVADVGPVSLFGFVDFPNDINPVNNQTSNLNVTVKPVGDFEIAIGTGNVGYKVPVDLWYRKSLSQTIYYPEELIIGAEISKIKYHANIATSGIPDKHQKIWMGTTNLRHVGDGWIDPATLTEVFDGDVSYPVANPLDVEIELTQPFKYMGGSLVIYTYKYDSNIYGAQSTNTHYGTAQTLSNRSRLFQSDASSGQEFDYMNPASEGAGGIIHGYPNIRMEVDVTTIGSLLVNVTYESNNLEGAEIRIVGANTHFLTNADGNYFFPMIASGTYPIEVSVEGLGTQTGSAVITNNNTTILNFNFEETIVAPQNLNIVVDDVDALFSWNNEILDDFESYDNFAKDNIGDYTVINNHPTQATHPIAGVTFPGSGTPMGWMVFNSTATTPAAGPEYAAYSGDKCLASFCNIYDTNDKWLILPQKYILPDTEFSFMAKSVSDFFNFGERFRVGVSTTGTDPADFTFISPWPYIAAPTTWTDYSFDLSDYVGQKIYIAINCVTENEAVFLVDDLFLGINNGSKGRAFSSYTVYLDGNEVVDNYTETTYLFTNLPGGDHIAGVKAVHTSGESPVETIQFTIPYYYTVTYNAPTNGTFSVKVDGVTVPNNSTVIEGTILTIEAEPNIGYHISTLTVNGTPLSGDTHTVTANTDIVCEFAINVYTITAVANPVAGNTVTGGGTYNHGDPVTLVATPENDVYNFVNWTKDGTEVSTDATYNFNASEDADYVANFVSAVSVTVTGFTPENGSLWADFNPAWNDHAIIDFSGSIVGSTFAGITVNGQTPVDVQVGMYQNSRMQIYYDFTWDTDYTIVVPADAIANYNGSNITYTFSTPPEMAIVALLPADEAIDVALDAEVSIEFNKPVFTNFIPTTITIQKVGSDFVTGVYYDPIPPINQETKLVIYHDNFEYSSDYIVTIPEFTFGYGEFTDEVVWTFTTMDNPGTEVILTLQANPEEGAETLIGGGTYEPGTVVPVSAIAATGYEFVNWTDGTEVVSTTAAFNYTMPDVNKTLTANFVEIGQVLLTLLANPSDGAETLIGGGTYEPGTIVPVNAIATVLYEFVDWTDGTEVVSTEASFNYTMPNENKTLTANFEYVGIKSLVSSTLSVYPNPATDKLYISSEISINAISLFDATGRIVLVYEKVGNSEFTIDISGLSSGVYFVNIDDTTIKVVKK